MIFEGTYNNDFYNVKAKIWISLKRHIYDNILVMLSTERWDIRESRHHAGFS